jgi:RNA polymerase sigma factor (sigma-70 family)
MGIWHPHEEAQLVEGCKNGSQIAQKQVFDGMRRILFSICLRYADNQYEAQDILQNGFIKVFKNINNFNGDGSFEGWIKRIVVNTAIDNYRRKKVKPVTVDSELTDRIGAGLEDEDEELSIYERVPIQRVLDAVQELSPVYKMVFNLYVMEGYNHNEIAEMLEISVGTSKSNLSKARLNLRKKLKPLIEKISQG